jgi:polar amino acid transport system permease protein
MATPSLEASSDASSGSSSDPSDDPSDDIVAASHDPHGLADLPNLKVVPARNPSRWAASIVVLVLLAMAIHALVTNEAFDWGTVWGFIFSTSIVEAVGVTLELTLVGIVMGFALGTVLALMRMSKSPLLQSVSWGYIWIFRAAPLILQLLFWNNLAILYPNITLGIPFGASFFSVDSNRIIGSLAAAALGISLHQAAYAAEIVRSGLLSVDQGQHEAAAALGIPQRRQLRRIILPQAMRTIIPTAGNEIIGLVKGTSVVYIMALPELFYQVQVISNRNGRIIALLLVATLWYLMITTILSIAQFYIERHYSKGAVRTMPPTPIQRLRATIGDQLAARRDRSTGKNALAAGSGTKP